MAGSPDLSDGFQAASFAVRANLKGCSWIINAIVFSFARIANCLRWTTSDAVHDWRPFGLLSWTLGLLSGGDAFDYLTFSSSLRRTVQPVIQRGQFHMGLEPVRFILD